VAPEGLRVSGSLRLESAGERSPTLRLKARVHAAGLQALLTAGAMGPVASLTASDSSWVLLLPRMKAFSGAHTPGPGDALSAAGLLELTRLLLEPEASWSAFERCSTFRSGKYAVRSCLPERGPLRGLRIETRRGPGGLVEGAVVSGAEGPLLVLSFSPERHPSGVPKGISGAIPGWDLVFDLAISQAQAVPPEPVAVRPPPLEWYYVPPQSLVHLTR